jgi:hypothetical protein
MSEDEFKDMVKTIRERDCDRPLDLKYSRKTKHVNLTDPKNRTVVHKVSLKELDDEIQRFTQISDGTGRSQWLLDGLLEARIRYDRMIDEKNKARGKQTNREQIRFKLQYASAWTYCFIQEQWKYQRERRYIPIQLAEDAVECLVESWHACDHSHQIRLLTAHLVGEAYKIEREKADLLDPLADYDAFNSESFYLTYIHPRLRDVKKRITKSDTLATFFRLQYCSTQIPTPPISFLRVVFLPFLR